MYILMSFFYLPDRDNHRVADNFGESVGFKTSATHKRAINIRLRHQVGDIVRLDASSVQNSKAPRRVFPESFSDFLADKSMNFLGLIRRGHFTRADCPNRFV